ncbi:cyclic nucleotide-binding domain-containing protein [Microvirga makkahensis]|uniref:Cyclic nucleotide-binding domain-containing protein n=1 Tax=Microvirga makkahensis TaxID=1128670 RepID=A0A7X3MRS5_9HYPH|nr:cyclic nucleotide-binding domain-containing protein [Microvirga makkahensis]MXQ11815.1 cyclic nucleotide-binding domain-containing protein [Microvirga makkahensis]
MALDDDIAALAQAPLFNLLERDALRLVAFASETRNLRAGDVLFRKGTPSDGGYVVSRGAIALDASEDGSPAAFVAGPGSLIGQAALFTRIARPATATAREASTIIRVTPSLMRRVLEEFPSAAAAMQQAMAEELARLTQGLERVRQQLIAIDGEESPARPPEE